jgi:predicted helicase
MATSGPIKPNHKAIKSYYEALKTYVRQDVGHESALRSAFQSLLDETGRRMGWTLIPELRETAQRQSEGKTVRPDGTLRDDYYITRGYWEAKDTDDNLETEIKRKIARGYPLGNTIFEDTRQAHLYQNGQLARKADITQPQPLADLLNAFFSYTEPAHESFSKAIGEFQERVPDLARGLVEKIQDAHRNNPRFIAAFEAFLSLCRSSLNPNLSIAAVDEMLVQHLLTERLIGTIFDNPDFTRRNVIAAEVEKVIDALVSKSFNRHEFLKSLDRFYLAIESAAATIGDFSEKQHFLNTVYERFFQGYSVKVADTHGIVYTPQEIVDFICSSVADVLQSEFGMGLGDEGVNILDPCTGTGNFIVNILRRIPKKDLPRMYREQLFANEVMLLPYYIAALNIEHAYYEQTGAYEPFAGLCFVDTLDLAKGRQGTLGFMTQENVARVERQKVAPITVILGNPPYNAWQLNENDNNKNRKYEVIDRRVSETYARDSRASNKNALSDMYVKFFRWATDRLNGRDGIVAFVSNNSFVDQIAFDGMRKHFLDDFARVYHVHLEGNVRQNPKLSGTMYNVFGIQVGVGITIAVHSRSHRKRRLLFRRVEKTLRREKKLAWLAQHGDVTGVKWQRLKPDGRHTWLVAANGTEFAALVPLGTKQAKADSTAPAHAVFGVYSVGIKTNRDDVVYDFHRPRLAQRIQQVVDDYNSEVDRYRRACRKADPDEFVRYEHIKWSESLKANMRRGRYATYHEGGVRSALYRPFTKRHVFFDNVLNERRYQFTQIFPVATTEGENILISVSDIAYRAKGFSALVSDGLVDIHLCASLDAHQCFPFYVYDENGTNRRENVTDWALKHFREHYRSKKITKWDIFYYVYGILHHPGYRERYAENLKRDLARIPLAPEFRPFANAGKNLARLHLDYEKLEPWPLDWIESPGVPLSYRVEDKMRLSKDKTALRVNDSLTLGGIPPEVFKYRVGNRSALQWVIDQYRVTEDKRSGIRSDPNRPDDPEYIVRLVGQVVRVSLDTVKIVKALPEDFGRDANGPKPDRE